MQLTLSYLKRSELRPAGNGTELSLQPNLARDRVAFDAPLLRPLPFREAVSALHDIVISDQRYQPRDKSAYEQWKKAEEARLSELRRGVAKEVRMEVLARSGVPDLTPDFLQEFEAARRRYWGLRQKYSSYLLNHDRELWRYLMPCDPVVTVAEDVVFFECFSRDESSYGCLTVDRESGFGRGEAELGTTNVDYSWDLYNHFQSLRTYRETRFRVDPGGFEVAVEQMPTHREEKIDLPEGWLRGFLQVQSGMTLPARRVELSREAVYSLLAWLKRHKAKESPRAVRFELTEGKAPRLVLEPWGVIIDSHATRWHGPSVEPIRIWGRQRLLALSRVLPLAERVDIHLLGTGLPSYWVAQMGPMRLTLGLSGWTANDWTRGSALDSFLPEEPVSRDEVGRAAEFLRRKRAATLNETSTELLLSPARATAVLNRLASTGQAIYDLHAGVFRWRQILPMAVGEEQLGPGNPEMEAARELARGKRVQLESRFDGPGGGAGCTGKVEGKPVELLLDADGRIRRGKCVCSHHFKFGLRQGPCRHLLAARTALLRERG